MKEREVQFSPEAKQDLFLMFDWIAAQSSIDIADGYAKRLELFCSGLDLASERGTKRNDIRLGLRIIGFERRVTIAFEVEMDMVTILRLFYGGQTWEELLS